jgi:predicted PurR-regulated permease PerM
MNSHFTFLMNFIPYIGSILAAVPPVIMAFIQFGPGPTGLWVMLAFLLVNFAVNYGIYPRLMGQSVDLSMFRGWFSGAGCWSPSA